MIEEAAASKQAKRLLPCPNGLGELARSLVNHALANAQQQQLLVASGDRQASKKTMESRESGSGGRFRSAGLELETGMELGTRQRFGCRWCRVGWSMIHSHL